MARGGVKQSTAGAPVEGPWALPEGWQWERLGSIGRWGSGGTPKAKSIDYYGGGIPWYKIGDLSDGILKGSADTITQAGLDASSAKWVPANALLIAMYGSIGKLGLTTEPVTTNQAIAFCVPDNRRVNLRYLFYFLLFRRHHLLSLGQGGTQQNISQTILLDEPIALPDADEQARIVARIDELLAEVDDGETALSRARDDLATWRKALLKAAVTGELTADWRGIKSHLRSKPLTYGAMPGDDRDEWTRTTVGEVASLQGGPAFKSVDYSLDGVFLVRIGDITGGSVTASPQSARLPFRFADESRRFIVRDGDILIAMSGATTAKFGRYAGVEPALLNQRVGRFKIRSEETLSTDYLAIWLGHQQAIILKAAYGGAQPNISAGAIEAMPIVLPPRAEQSEIVARLHSSLRQVSERSAELGELAAASSALRQSILAAAFRGDLA